MSPKPLSFKFQHYLWLAGIIFLGTTLRFWQLDLKPLWPDEIITALFSLGRSYNDVPLNVVFPLDGWQEIFRLRPSATCAQVARTVATQSVHPPLFFCLMHHWLAWISSLAQPLSWSLRALPALFGVSAIAAIYLLNRVAFSPAAGLMAAGLMAVSPFAVYLSQEARHYTLPMLLSVSALLGLVHLLRQLTLKQATPGWVWVGWISINSIGFYVHYFFILAFVAQVITLFGWMLQHGDTRRHWRRAGLAVIAVLLTYLPWLPTLLGHFSRPETDWLRLSDGGWSDRLAPLYQTLAGWIIMAIALPVEGQPVWIVIPTTLVMLGFGGWLVWQVWPGVKRLWRDPATHLATWTLTSFTLGVLLQFFVIAYILGKDITVAPRYNFTYYPGICALLGASLVKLSDSWPQVKRPGAVWIQAIVLLVGLLSCSLVVFNLAFHKPFAPEQVARDIRIEPTLPLVIVVGYDTFQDIALGLSYAREIDKLNPSNDPRPKTYLAFFPQTPSLAGQISAYQGWQVLSQQSFNLWMINPRRSQVDFPPQLRLPERSSLEHKQISCRLDPTRYYQAFGIPYQLYRCQPGTGL